MKKKSEQVSLVNRERQKVVKRKKHLPVHRRSAILFFIAAVTAFTLIFFGRHLLLIGSAWNYFTIKEVEILGNSSIPEEQIKAWTGITEGINMLRCNLGNITSVAEARPWIRSLSVSRRFPAKVTIEVEERWPIAIWEDEGGRYLMDEFGLLLELDNNVYASLPVFTGLQTGLSACVGKRCPSPYWPNGMCVVECIRKVYPELMEDVCKICIVSEDNVTILLKDGRKILCNLSNIAVNLPMVRRLIKKVPDIWQSMGYCDLRFDGKIIFG